MSSSALRDIIPCNDDDVSIKKARQKRFSNICKILIFVFLLGFIAIGIVALALILGYSSKSFIYLIMQSSEANVSTLSNLTRTLTFHQENLTEISNEQELKKITIIPINNNQEIHIPSIVKTKQENQYISTNTQSMKSYQSLNTIVDEQSTFPTIQVTMSNRQSTIQSSVTINNKEYVEASEENKITTIDTLTSTFLMPKIQDHEMATSEAIPLTTSIDLQLATNQNKKTMVSKKHKKVNDDDVIDDLLLI
ncbi:unnamed protein product [Rotaria sp. Silwood1]|nr:unnamed protein product [Rotaria sp. Silwood1]CAF1360404.1 unnamed protein product [Rotaria sp. Silwood1]CAF3573599.1 unnamed protein product [Rotaria sp. Silwood1]CAF3598732.1 unnamed protein product [Rotaria sp. Silwood1]CAF4685804.1 unnamed protein product [Rotaria sp. Silwood1]